MKTEDNYDPFFNSFNFFLFFYIMGIICVIAFITHAHTYWGCPPWQNPTTWEAKK